MHTNLFTINTSDKHIILILVYCPLMLDLLTANPTAFLAVAGVLVVAITIHEFAHAYVADKLGDPTPRNQDRVTLNPLAHLDPIGTIALVLIGFGWGRPVPFDPYNLKDPVRDSALIALAGPVSNIIMAVMLALVLQLGVVGGVLTTILIWSIQINLVLAIFNLIPVHPLDGSKIIMALLPKESAINYEGFMERYGLFVLLAMLLPWNGTSPVQALVGPIINVAMTVLVG